jgi:hypothetical protein
LVLFFFCWKSFSTWVENWWRRSSMVGGMSDVGGFQDDLT